MESKVFDGALILFYFIFKNSGYISELVLTLIVMILPLFF